jgi:coproporphyrinogen III oxidase-like Fe-S oxidoreductase
VNRNLAPVTRNVPRYTSYPTAPHFTGDVEGQTCAAWLQEVAADATISLYLHVPFCRAICHYDLAVAAARRTLRRNFQGYTSNRRRPRASTKIIDAAPYLFAN